MKKLKIYLDTSVINFLFAEDAPDFKKATEEFFKTYSHLYELYISDVVLLELNKTPDLMHRKKLLKVIDNISVQILALRDDEVLKKLISSYHKEKVIPLKKKEDALHIALATIHEMDILLSWNFKHLANIRKQIAINAINEREGFLKKLYLLSPLEVEYED